MHPSEYGRLFENEATHWWFQGRRALTQAMLAQHLPPSAGRQRQILDAGCGTGGNLGLLGQFGAVTAIDLSPIALGFAAERTRQGTPARLARASLLQLPFADNSFDLVTAFDVLYHLWVEDDVAAMHEFRRVLRPGGLFFMTDSAWRRLHSAHDEMNLARQRYEAPELRAKLLRAGFEPRKVSYANFLLLPLVLAYRSAQRLMQPSAEPKSDVAPVAPPLNRILGEIYRREANLLPHMDFPRGSSVVAIARRGA